MKQTNILCLIVYCAIMVVSCGKSSKNAGATTSVVDDRPPLEYSDADRTFSVTLEITPDSLMTCYNNFSGKDEDPLILDTSNPAFPDLFSQWVASMDPTQISQLKKGSDLHISVQDGVKDATIEKVKRNLINCGINGFSISNF